jgi:hypothetical protein
VSLDCPDAAQVLLYNLVERRLTNQMASSSASTPPTPTALPSGLPVTAAAGVWVIGALNRPKGAPASGGSPQSSQTGVPTASLDGSVSPRAGGGSGSVIAPAPVDDKKYDMLLSVHLLVDWRS